MTMTVKGFEKNNGVASVVVSIPLDELFNIPALNPILEQLTAPDVSGIPMQDNSAPVADVIKTRKPRQKKAAAPAVEVAPVVKPTYPNRKSAPVAPAITPAPAKPVKPSPTAPVKSDNTNEAKMHSHCPHCKPEQFATYKQWLAAGYKVIPGQHGAKLMGISEAIVNGVKTNRPFFFTKFCSCQVEAVAAKQVG